MAKAKPTNDNIGKHNYRLKLIRRIILGSTISQILFRCYLLIIIIGSVLLYVPISLQQHGQMVIANNGWTEKYTFWDAMFIAVSALTNTGLSPAIISRTMTGFGQVVMLVLMEVGGLGLLTIVFLIWNLFKRGENQVNINQLILLQSERGSQKISGTLKSLRSCVLFVLCAQVAFALLYSFWLCFYPQIYEQTAPASALGMTNVLSVDDITHHYSSYHHYSTALWQGVFFSVSCINNAGFDNFNNGVSLAALRNDWNVIFQLFVLLELFLGGIGFPVIYDFISAIRSRNKKQQYKFSLFTKISLISYFFFTVFGLILAFSFEFTDHTYFLDVASGFKIYDIAHYKDVAQQGIIAPIVSTPAFGKNTLFNKCFAIFFNTCATRSAGFSTVNCNIFSGGLTWVFTVLMFIGASPSSTGGGIRCTTLFIIFLMIFKRAIGRDEVRIFHKTISQKTINDSFFITFIAIALVVFSGVIIYYCCPLNNIAKTAQFNIASCLFEVSSAFGTVGFSVGVTSEVKTVGLVILCFVMFIGQIGISAAILSWAKRNPRGNRIHYPEEEVRVG